MNWRCRLLLLTVQVCALIRRSCCLCGAGTALRSQCQRPPTCSSRSSIVRLQKKIERLNLLGYDFPERTVASMISNDPRVSCCYSAHASSISTIDLLCCFTSTRAETMVSTLPPIQPKIPSDFLVPQSAESPTKLVAGH